MLFDSVAEYDTEIAEVRESLKKSIKEQVITHGGVGQGQHTVRGAVRDIREYLELLSKERDRLLLRESGGTVNRAEFGRES